MNPYFPGDAPGAEMLSVLGALLCLPAGLLLAVLLAITRRRPAARLAVVSLLVLPVALGVGAMGYGAAEIAGRHFGQWAELKAMLVRYSRLVAVEAATGGGRLTEKEYRDIQARLLTPAPTFRFAGTEEPVRLRMMMTVAPYVGVDFGHGANAVFDPQTMWCIYSD